MTDNIWILLGLVAFAVWIAWRALRMLGAMGPARRRLTPRERRVAALRRRREEAEELKAAREREKARQDESAGEP